MSLVQTSSLSKPHPDEPPFRAQLPSSSSLVHSRAPAFWQMDSATLKDFDEWQPLTSDAAQTSLHRLFENPCRLTSEQHRTSCSSLATSVVRSFGAMLLFTVLAEDEAIVVEQPWLRVVQHFSPALYKHRFGT